jgi:hypothetical protein
MPKLRFVLLIALVTIAAAGTVGLAWFAVAEDILPLWQAGLGPMLLVTLVFVRWRTAKLQAEADAARSGATPGE